jgi:hypothetical protein
MRTILAATSIFCGLMWVASCNSASAASKNPDHVSWSSHYKHKLQKQRVEPRSDPDLRIHGFIGGGVVSGYVGSQGQAGW